VGGVKKTLGPRRVLPDGSTLSVDVDDVCAFTAEFRSRYEIPWPFEPLEKLFRSWFDKLTMNEISMSYQAEVRSP
jgi:hypothetical protein